MLQVSSGQCVQLFSNCITSTYFSARWVKVNGTTYKPTNVVVQGIEDDFPKVCNCAWDIYCRNEQDCPQYQHSYNRAGCLPLPWIHCEKIRLGTEVDFS